MKYSELTLGKVEAIINKLGGMEGVEKFLRGELTVSEPARTWREQDGVIYFTLPPTDGTAGSQWIERLEKKGFRNSDWAKSILKSEDFKPTSGITYEIAVLKGMLWNDNERTTKNIRAEADKRKWFKPNAEVACLIREMFTDKELEEMGLWWIVTMHEPIKDSDGDPNLLDAHRYVVGSWLGAAYDEPDFRWYRGLGFAFVASQVST